MPNNKMTRVTSFLDVNRMSLQRHKYVGWEREIRDSRIKSRDRSSAAPGLQLLDLELGVKSVRIDETAYKPLRNQISIVLL